MNVRCLPIIPGVNAQCIVTFSASSREAFIGTSELAVRLSRNCNLNDCMIVLHYGGREPHGYF